MRDPGFGLQIPDELSDVASVQATGIGRVVVSLQKPVESIQEACVPLDSPGAFALRLARQFETLDQVSEL